MSRDFTLETFAQQLSQLKRGPRTQPDLLSQVMDFFREDQATTLARLEAILTAIPPELRADPQRIGSAECARIAAASGQKPEDIRLFLEQFQQLREMMLSLGTMTFWQRLRIFLGWKKLPGPRSSGDSMA